MTKELVHIFLLIGNCQSHNAPAITNNAPAVNNQITVLSSSFSFCEIINCPASIPVIPEAIAGKVLYNPSEFHPCLPSISAEKSKWSNQLAKFKPGSKVPAAKSFVGTKDRVIQ